MNAFSTLTEACHRVGKKIPHWVQGAGGNISFKQDGTLFIKASGVRLDSVTVTSGIARVKLNDVTTRLNSCEAEADYAACLMESAEKGSERPSMETGFHALLPHAWVLHFHSLAAVLMSFEHKRNQKKFDEWFNRSSKAKVEWLGPLLPGLTLSKRVSKGQATEIFFLENHGVILQGSNLDVLDRWETLERSFVEEFQYHSVAKKVDWKWISPCPFRIFFPDAQVFKSRMLALLEKNEELKPEPQKLDRDAAELWAATSLLYHAQKNLPELPKELFAQIDALPTEQFRKGEAVK